MSAAHDAALRVLADEPTVHRNTTGARHAPTLARFVAAVCEPDERLVEDVAGALYDEGCAPDRGSDWDEQPEDEHESWRDSARAALAVIAQSAGGEDRV